MDEESAAPFSQYNNMNAGAHRRPPPQIAAPALTWQRGYWKPPQRPDEVERGYSDADWHRNIDNVLAHLFRHVCLSKPDTEYSCPNYDRHEDTLFLFTHKVTGVGGKRFVLEPLSVDELSVRHGIFTIRAPFDNADLIISSRRHSENFVIMFALDFSEDRAEPSDHLMRTVSRHFDELHNQIIQRYSDQQGLAGSREVSAFDRAFEQAGAEAEKRYQGLLMAFQGLVTRVLDGAAKDRCNGHGNRLESCGELFSDFTGIIYSLRVESDRNLTLATHPSDEGALKRSAQIKGTNFKRKNRAWAVLDAAWPVITAVGKDQKADKNYGEPERVVAAFNSGRTIYVSTLGRLVPDSSAHSEPVIYTLLVSFPSRWRLGRFIDQLHSMGTLRLAALRDLNSINNASIRIDEISRLLTSSDRHPDRILDSVGLREHLNAVGSDLEFGLKHRVERSRFYVSAYKAILQSLRPERIQGFHFYPDFVRSRVFDAFDYISRVGLRYDDLWREVNQRLTLSHRQQTQQLQDAISRQTSSVTRLLEFAEILGVIPLTYYGATILHDVAVDVRHHSWLDWLPATRSAYFLPALLLSLALALVSRGFRRRKEAALNVAIVAGENSAGAETQSPLPPA